MPLLRRNVGYIVRLKSKGGKRFEKDDNLEGGGGGERSETHEAMS